MDLTPLTLLTISPALSTACSELTKPLNWISPLNVSTLIWNTFSDGSSKVASFTLVVITELSTYSPGTFAILRGCAPQEQCYQPDADQEFYQAMGSCRDAFSFPVQDHAGPGR